MEQTNEKTLDDTFQDLRAELAAMLTKIASTLGRSSTHELHETAMLLNSIALGTLDLSMVEKMHFESSEVMW